MNILRKPSSSSLSVISHHYSSQSLPLKRRKKQIQTGRQILGLDMEENRKGSKNTKKDDINSQYNDDISRSIPTIGNVDTLMNKNRLTLHFEERSKSELPDISTFKKAQKLLISPFHFKKYQELSGHSGRHQSTIQQVEREINAYRAKISITKSSKIVFRQNIHAPRVSVKQISDQLINNQFKKRKTKSQSLGLVYQLTLLAKSKISKSVKKHSKVKDNWKLKDFYDSIVQELDERGMRMIKEREKVINKLKHINGQCDDMASNACLANSINVFSQFCKKMTDKLVKKHRKIDKICYFRY